MRKSLIGIILLSIVIFGIALPIGFSAQSNTKVITYGETTYNNANYKSVVDDFFKQQAHVDVKSIDSKIITAGEVNKVASTITGKTYTSGQIFSSALVDLSEQGNIKVTVDKSKITTITADMYISALKSAGITHGHVYVTSPVSATGESALAGIMNAYEQVTDVEIPDVDPSSIDFTQYVKGLNLPGVPLAPLADGLANSIMTIAIGYIVKYYLQKGSAELKGAKGRRVKLRAKIKALGQIPHLLAEVPMQLGNTGLSWAMKGFEKAYKKVTKDKQPIVENDTFDDIERVDEEDIVKESPKKKWSFNFWKKDEV